MIATDPSFDQALHSFATCDPPFPVIESCIGSQPSIIRPWSGVIVAKRKVTATTDAEEGKGNGQEGAETISGYFRRLFEENPQWLEERSNQALLDRWLKDHPGETEVPE